MPLVKSWFIGLTVILKIVTCQSHKNSVLYHKQGKAKTKNTFKIGNQSPCWTTTTKLHMNNYMKDHWRTLLQRHSSFKFLPFLLHTSWHLHFSNLHNTKTTISLQKKIFGKGKCHSSIVCSVVTCWAWSKLINKLLMTFIFESIHHTLPLQLSG